MSVPVDPANPHCILSSRSVVRKIWEIRIRNTGDRNEEKVHLERLVRRNDRFVRNHGARHQALYQNQHNVIDAAIPFAQRSFSRLAMVQNALEGWEVGKLDFLFVENVGNLVCPSSYDLGEDLRLVLLSVTEGEDKPLKYPTIFNSADVAVITKIDLAGAVDFDEAAVRANIQAVRPVMQVFTISSKNGAGMETFFDFLVHRSADMRAVTPA